MVSSRPPVSRAVALFFLLALAPSAARAQPSLASLWPVDLGRSWEFDVVVESTFGGTETGTLTQTVAGQIALASGATSACFSVVATGQALALPGAPPGLSPFEQRLWIARPDLREKLPVAPARQIPDRPSLLLALPGCGFDVGLLADEDTALGIWSNPREDWDWWWVPADPAVGSSFRLQLVPELTNDTFLNGEVRTLEGVVTTAAGSFTDAVIVDYLIEFGEAEILDAGGNVLGTGTWETTGWIAFVPDVGPVASEEVFAPVALDCPQCPPEASGTSTTTMELNSTTPVDAQARSFGSLKARY